MAVIVTIKKDDSGNLRIRPASDSMAKSYAEDVQANGGPRAKSPYERILESGEQADAFLAKYVPSAARSELSEGWVIRQNMDAWVIRGLYGYQDD